MMITSVSKEAQAEASYTTLNMRTAHAPEYICM